MRGPPPPTSIAGSDREINASVEREDDGEVARDGVSEDGGRSEPRNTAEQATSTSSLVKCCTPGGCGLQNILPGSSQHKCSTCGGHFHARCAYDKWKCDDTDQCGCLNTDIQAEPELRDLELIEWEDVLSQEAKHNKIVARLKLPSSVRTAREIEVWSKALTFEGSKARLPEALGLKDPEDVVVWTAAKKELNRARAAMRQHVSRQRKRAMMALDQHRKRLRALEQGDCPRLHPHDNELDLQAATGDNCHLEHDYIGAARLARLYHAVAAPENRDAVDIITEAWQDRQVQNDKHSRILPWQVLADWYNNADNCPVNAFLDDVNSDRQLHELDPSEPPGKITAAQAKKTFIRTKSRINKLMRSFAASGMMGTENELPKSSFTTNVGILYCWKLCDLHDVLHTAVSKQLPPDHQADSIPDARAPCADTNGPTGATATNRHHHVVSIAPSMEKLMQALADAIAAIHGNKDTAPKLQAAELARIQSEIDKNRAQASLAELRQFSELSKDETLDSEIREVARQRCLEIMRSSLVPPTTDVTPSN